MRIIKVDAIGSTNTFLRNLYREEGLKSSACVVANEQTKGKGQMGTVWVSDAGKNLTFSVFLPIQNIELSKQFNISMAASLALVSGLEELLVPKLAIKWPNDILSDRYKICGILIENIVKNGRLEGVVLGVGLNVNQLHFEGLPQAASLKQITGKHYDLEEVLSILLAKVNNQFDSNEKLNGFCQLREAYEGFLFRKNKPSTFIDVKGDSFVGIINSVTPEGRLQLLLEDEIYKEFDLKEIKLLY